jgi:hypothetical protein
MTDEELNKLEQAVKGGVQLVAEVRRTREGGAPRRPAVNPAEQLSFDSAVAEDRPPPRHSALRAIRTPPPPARMVPTNVRLREEQWAWLRREATERALRRPGSRGDASVVLRELLDAYIAQRGAA